MADAVQIVGGPEPVWPARDAAQLPSYDARNAALMQFRRFLSELVFRRSGANGETIPFRLPIGSIHIYQPDDIVKAVMPGVGIIPGVGNHETYGLGPPQLDDESFGLWGEGQALVRQSDYVETFTVEVWGSKQAERRALVAGIQAALRMNQDSYATRLRLPNYFDQVASFELVDTQYIDGDEVVRNRRRAMLFVKLQVAEVVLTNAVCEKTPELLLYVYEASELADVCEGSIHSGCACSC